MMKNKALEVIKTYDQRETKEFERFIASGFHNSNKAIIKLFALIKKNIHKLNEEKHSEEYFYSKIFPGRNYNYGIMKNLLSELFGLCENFLSGYTYENDNALEFEEGLRRLQYYMLHSLDKLFFAEYRQLEKQIEYSVLRPEYFFNKSRLVEKLYKFYTRKSQYQGAADTLYPMSIYNTCFIISTLKHDVAGMEYLKSQLNYTPEVNPTDALYKSFDSENFLKQLGGLDPVYYKHITLEIKLMKLYNEPDNWENYYELKELIFKSMNDYSNSEKWHLTSALFGFVLNEYIAKSNKELLSEIASIRKVQLANVKFNTEGLGPMQAGVFRNIVELFVILGEFNIAVDFIERFINELEEDKRKSIYSFSMALIEESRGNNEKVLDLLRNIEFTDYQAKFSAKMVAMVAFYNLGYIEQGLSAVDSMKHFIKDTEEFSAPMKKNLGQRVATLEKLFKIKANPEKYSIADISALEENAEVYFGSRKDWFLAKTTELKKLVQ